MVIWPGPELASIWSKALSSVSRPASHVGGAGSWRGLSGKRFALMLAPALAPEGGMPAQAARAGGPRRWAVQPVLGLPAHAGFGQLLDLRNWLTPRIPEEVAAPAGGPGPGLLERMGQHSIQLSLSGGLPTAEKTPHRGEQPSLFTSPQVTGVVSCRAAEGARETLTSAPHTIRDPVSVRFSLKVPRPLLKTRRRSQLVIGGTMRASKGWP